MKIIKSSKSLASATEILAYLRGDEDTTASLPDPVLTVWADGDLMFHNRACDYSDCETILFGGGFSPDSMGCGWDEPQYTAADVIDWLNEFAMTEIDA